MVRSSNAMRARARAAGQKCGPELAVLAIQYACDGLGALNIGACALAVIFLSICSRTILEGESERNFSGCPHADNPLVAAGIEYFPAVGDTKGVRLIAPTASQTSGRKNNRSGVRTPDH